MALIDPNLAYYLHPDFDPLLEEFFAREVGYQQGFTAMLVEMPWRGLVRTCKRLWRPRASRAPGRFSGAIVSGSVFSAIRALRRY